MSTASGQFDALLGHQTRAYEDLDIAIPHEHVPSLRELLATRDYHEQRRDDAWECNFVLADGCGRELDVHSYELDDAGTMFMEWSTEGNPCVGGEPSIGMLLGAFLRSG